MDNSTRKYRIEHGNEILESVSFADVPAELERLVAKYGAPPAPKVTEIITAEVVSPPVQSIPSSIEISETGLARSQADRLACVKAGFAPAETMFARGTKVIQLGVDNARLARQEYEAKPKIGEALSALRETIASEQRRDEVVRRTSIYMNANGQLKIDGKIYELTGEAFKQLCTKMGLPAGAGQYLSECWPELRARNVNNWTKVALEEESESKGEPPDTIVLRTRRVPGLVDPSVFACVTERYSEFDADKFAQAIELAVSPDARCQVTYDGQRAKIEALFHSTVKPEDYVCGEFFRAGLVMRTDDTGRGGLRGYSVVEQNLCLNLIITSKDAQPIFQVSHLSDVRLIAKRIQEGLRKAEDTLSYFLKQWGYARQDDLVAAAKARGELYAGMKMTEIFAALANGVIERELVPVRGRRDVVVPQLMAAWQEDSSGDGPTAGTVTRAGLVNAFTRWAHKENEMWSVDKTEVGAASLLWPDDRLRVPPSIPAIPLEC